MAQVSARDPSPIKTCTSGVAGDFHLQVNWLAYLREDFTKAFQACICLQSERLVAVIILVYGCPGGLFLDGFKCFNVFRALLALSRC